MSWRKKIYYLVEIPEAETDNDKFDAYDIFMIITIFVSIIPLAIKETNIVLEIIDKVAAAIFIMDYLFRWLTADFKINKGGISFLLYPFTLMAIIDLITILPSLLVINSGFRLLKVIRLIRTLKILRVFKAYRYSKSLQMIIDVFVEQKDSLIAVGGLAIGYVLIVALVILNVEPESFNTYFDALYWAVVSLTTVGYGDLYPVSVAGRVVSMISSFVGVAIVALPAGIIASGFKSHVDSDE